MIDIKLQQGIGQQADDEHHQVAVEPKIMVEDVGDINDLQDDGIDHTEGEEKPSVAVFRQQIEDDAAGQREGEQHEGAVLFHAQSDKEDQVDHKQGDHGGQRDGHGLFAGIAGFKKKEEQDEGVDHRPQNRNIS